MRKMVDPVIRGAIGQAKQTLLAALQILRIGQHTDRELAILRLLEGEPEVIEARRAALRDAERKAFEEGGR